MVMSDIPLTLVLQNKANEIHQRHGKGKHKRKKKKNFGHYFLNFGQKFSNFGQNYI